MSIKRKLDFTLKIPDFIAGKDDQIYAGAFDRQMPVSNKYKLDPPNIYFNNLNLINLKSTYKLTNNNETETIGSITYNIFKLETNTIGFSSANYNTKDEQIVRNTLSFTFYKNPRSEKDHMSRIERGFRRKILLFNEKDQAVDYTNNTITKTYILNQENDTDSYPIYRKLNFIVRINGGTSNDNIYIGGGTIGNFNAYQLDYNTTTTDGNVSQYVKSIYVVNKRNVEEGLINYWKDGISTKFSARKNDVAFNVFMGGDEVIMSQGTVSNDNNKNKITLALNENDKGLEWNNYNRLKNVLDIKSNETLINSDIDIILNGSITPLTYKFIVVNSKTVKEGQKIPYSVQLKQLSGIRKFIPYKYQVKTLDNIPSTTAKPNVNYTPVDQRYTVKYKDDEKDSIFIETLNDNTYTENKNLHVEFKLLNWNTDNGYLENTTIKLDTTINNINSKIISYDGNLYIPYNNNQLTFKLPMTSLYEASKLEPAKENGIYFDQYQAEDEFFKTEFTQKLYDKIWLRGYYLTFSCNFDPSSDVKNITLTNQFPRPDYLITESDYDKIDYFNIRQDGQKWIFNMYVNAGWPLDPIIKQITIKFPEDFNLKLGQYNAQIIKIILMDVEDGHV